MVNPIDLNAKGEVAFIMQSSVFRKKFVFNTAEYNYVNIYIQHHI